MRHSAPLLLSVWSLVLLTAVAAGSEESKKDEKQRVTARRYLRRLKAVGSREVQLRMISDVDQITPGEAFRVALYFSLGSGWHIYGHEPGEGYLPSKIEWPLPDGFRLKKVHWPRPEQVDSFGTGMKFPAYHHRVMVVATILPPKTLKTGQTVKLQAKANWQFCHTDGVCRLGQGKPECELTVGKAKPSRFAILFRPPAASSESLSPSAESPNESSRKQPRSR